MGLHHSSKPAVGRQQATGEAIHQAKPGWPGRGLPEVAGQLQSQTTKGERSAESPARPAGGAGLRARLQFSPTPRTMAPASAGLRRGGG